MLGKFFNTLKTRFAVRSLEKNPIYQAAFVTIRETLSDDSKCLGKYAPQKVKEELAERLIREVEEVAVAKNPIMMNREKLVSYVLEMAKYQVLVMPSPDEPEEEVTGLRGKPGITGELKKHISEIADKDKTIKELAWNIDNSTPQALYDACVLKYWIAGFMASVFQSTRIALGDYHPAPEKDWYRPFVAAMCACEEHNFREAIGLPDVLASQDDYKSMAALRFSTFVNFVLSDAKYPHFEWEEHYKRKKD